MQIKRGESNITRNNRRFYPFTVTTSYFRTLKVYHRLKSVSTLVHTS